MLAVLESSELPAAYASPLVLGQPRSSASCSPPSWLWLTALSSRQCLEVPSAIPPGEVSRSDTPPSVVALCVSASMLQVAPLEPRCKRRAERRKSPPRPDCDKVECSLREILGPGANSIAGIAPGCLPWFGECHHCQRAGDSRRGCTSVLPSAYLHAPSSVSAGAASCFRAATAVPLARAALAL